MSKKLNIDITQLVRNGNISYLTSVSDIQLIVNKLDSALVDQDVDEYTNLNMSLIEWTDDEIDIINDSVKQVSACEMLDPDNIDGATPERPIDAENYAAIEAMATAETLIPGYYYFDVDAETKYVATAPDAFEEYVEPEPEPDVVDPEVEE